MTVTLKETFFWTAVILVISTDVCWGSDTPKSSYGPSRDNNNYNNNKHGINYESEFNRPLAVFTERPVNVADFVLIPVIQVPSSDLRMIYRPQIDGVSKTEPIVMCRSSTRSYFEATPAVQVPLQQPFYMYDERTLIPFPKTVTILHGGYRMLIPVGVVVAPIPVGVLRSGPVLVTTLYAIPAGPLPVTSSVPARYVPSYPPVPSAPQYSPSPPLYSQPSPQLYPQLSPPLYPQPSPPPYSQSPAYPSPPPYSQPAPPSPAYYQHSTGDYNVRDTDEDGGGDLRIRDPPGKLYSQAAAVPLPFQNSKESPLLHQLREESEKNRNKYAPQPSYSSQYLQTIDA